MTCDLALLFIGLMAYEGHKLIDEPRQTPAQTLGNQEVRGDETHQAPTQTSGTKQVRLDFDSSEGHARPELLKHLLPRILPEAAIETEDDKGVIIRIPNRAVTGLGQAFQQILRLSEENVDAFIPAAGIEESIIKDKLGSLVKGGYYLRTGENGGKPGYVVSIPGKKMGTMKSVIEELMKLSKVKGETESRKRLKTMK